MLKSCLKKGKYYKEDELENVYDKNSFDIAEIM